MLHFGSRKVNFCFPLHAMHSCSIQGSQPLSPKAFPLCDDWAEWSPPLGTKATGAALAPAA